MSREYQKELFKEFKEEGDKFKKITDKIKKTRPGLHANMPLENIVIGAIIIIMAVIISFALGVERGRRMVVKEAEAPKITQKSDKAEIKLEPIEATAAPATKNAAELPYTIQLVSFKQKEPAEQEKRKLLKRNIEAFIAPSGNWYQVCAGNYETVKDAEKALKDFKKDYKGSFVRNK